MSITGLALTGQDGGKTRLTGKTVHFDSGEYAGYVAILDSVIPMRYSKEDITYRGRLQGPFASESARNITVTARTLQNNATVVPAGTVGDKPARKSMEPTYRVKSLKKNGSYFGQFKSLDDACVAADTANAEQKFGADDWEPEEKAASYWKDILRMLERAAAGIAKQNWRETESAVHEAIGYARNMHNHES